MTERNRRWLLARRPIGIVGREHFEWLDEPVPSVGEGEFLVRNRWLSCDPAQRTWMEIDTYIPMLPLGEVMAAAAAGVVVQSKHPTSRWASWSRVLLVGRTMRSVTGRASVA